MNTAALSRNPSSVAPARNAAARLVTMIFGRLVRSRRIWKDRRTLQTVPAYLLADMGLERAEVRTTSGSLEVLLRPRRH